MEAFDFAAGLGVVGAGVLVVDAEREQLELDGAGPVAGRGGEDGAVVGEHRRGQAVVAAAPRWKVSHDVGGFGGHERPGRDQQAGVVVDDVEDLHVGAVGERPVGGVGLPALVGQLGLEPPPRALGPLVGLGGDEPPAGQHPPDRRDRRHRPAAAPVASVR